MGREVGWREVGWREVGWSGEEGGVGDSRWGKG